MRGTWPGRLLIAATGLTVTIASSALTSGQKPDASTGVLDEHPAIQYASRPTTDRVARFSLTVSQRGQTLARDPRTGFLLPVLQALGVPVESQLLVFSKTGVQRTYTGPQTPRALFFDQSVVVAYVPGAPLIELAAHDPQQGVVFYTIDQTAAAPVAVRRTSCLSCHVSATTLGVPGIIARSNTVGEDGNVMPQFGSENVNHRTAHSDRWGGWYVTSEAVTPYGQRAHAGNITSTGREITSNHVFVEWMRSAPDTRGYLSPYSDIVALLTFDHQMHAINLLTKLNWESRVAASNGEANAPGGTLRASIDELADYLLFVGEAPPSAPLDPVPAFAEYLAARTPTDRHGRSLGQLDAVDRLMRYPCSYMVYSEAFDGLSPAVKGAVYGRMLEILSGHDTRAKYAHLTPIARTAVLEILRDTKPDFPAH